MALEANNFNVAKHLSEQALNSDQTNDVVLRAVGIIRVHEAQKTNSIIPAQQAIDCFTEAKDLEPNEKNVRNFFLIKKMLWIMNQEIISIKKSKIEAVCQRNGVDSEGIKRYLKNTDLKSLEHVPKEYICPLTLVH